jgi:hypothetical protein
VKNFSNSLQGKKTKILKLRFLAALAMSAALVACGGGEDVVGDALGKDSVENLTASSRDPLIVDKPAAWAQIGNDIGAMGKSLILEGVLASPTVAKSAGGAPASHLADGVVMNVDNPPEGWVDTIRTALKSGQRVVLLASGDGSRLFEATLQLTGIGVKGANAVLVLQDDPSVPGYGLLPFTESEIKELSEFMAFQHRRVDGAS